MFFSYLSPYTIIKISTYIFFAVSGMRYRSAFNISADILNEFKIEKFINTTAKGVP